MTLRHHEDMAVGERIDLGCRKVGEDEALAFAREFDPQPFHLNREAAANSLMGGLTASGWHTAAMLTRMLWDSWLGLANGAGSPGVMRHSWISPLYVGDTFCARGVIKEMRVSKSMPGVGFVELELKATASDSRRVCSTQWTVMVRTRGGPKPDFEERRRKRRKAKRNALEGPSKSSKPGRDMLYWDLCRMERPLSLGEVSATTEEVIRFSRAYIPQPFHIDEELAKKSHFGCLVASGWHSCALWMRANVTARLRVLESLSGEERSYAMESGGIGLGFEDLRWISPVRANEKLKAYITPLERQRSRSRPGWGKVRARAELVNSEDKLAIRFYPTVYMRESPEANGKHG